jgi:hypothetical protein
LRAAAAVLIEFWQRTHSGEKFTNGKWNGLEPISGAALFLFDELRRIDPRRPRLAEQLKDIMATAVAKTLDARRGRKVKGKQQSNPLLSKFSRFGEN